MLHRLLAMILSHRSQPAQRVGPLPPAPSVTTTPAAERRSIEERLRGVESRIAVLMAEAGLEERRTRERGAHPSAQ